MEGQVWHSPWSSFWVYEDHQLVVRDDGEQRDAEGHLLVTLLDLNTGELLLERREAMTEDETPPDGQPWHHRWRRAF